MKATLHKPCDPENTETLERLRRWPKLSRKFNGRKVHIFSTEHMGYWRAGGHGYTDKAEEAGQWTIEEAIQNTCHCDPSKGIQFYAVKPPRTSYTTLRQVLRRLMELPGTDHMLTVKLGTKSVNYSVSYLPEGKGKRVRVKGVFPLWAISKPDDADTHTEVVQLLAAIVEMETKAGIIK